MTRWLWTLVVLAACGDTKPAPYVGIWSRSVSLVTAWDPVYEVTPVEWCSRLEQTLTLSEDGAYEDIQHSYPDEAIQGCKQSAPDEKVETRSGSWTEVQVEDDGAYILAFSQTRLTIDTSPDSEDLDEEVLDTWWSSVGLGVGESDRMWLYAFGLFERSGDAP